MCSGRIDPIFILTAFEQGLDGVLVTGCHLADCHYLSGNYYAKYKVLITKKLLEKCGLDSRRLRLEWISAAEGLQFADLVTDFTGFLRELGASPVKTDPELRAYLERAKEVGSEFRLRWFTSRARDLIEFENAYGERISEEKYSKILDDIINQELNKHKILELIKKRGLSAEEIAHRLHLPVEKTMRYLITLSDEHKINFTTENYVAIFTKIEGVIEDK